MCPAARPRSSSPCQASSAARRPAASSGAARRRRSRPRRARSRRGRARRAGLGGQPPGRPVERRVVAPLHAAAQLVGARRATGPSVSRHAVRSAGRGPARPRAALRHRQGRGRQDDGGRRASGCAAAARGRRTIVCEVGEQGRCRARFAPRGRAARAGGRAGREPLGHLDRPDRGAAGVARRASSPARAAADHAARPRSSTSSPPRPARKELITIAKVWELAQLERWERATAPTTSSSSTRPPRATALAMLTAPRTFGEIARVGPIRRQACKVRDTLDDPARTG